MSDIQLISAEADAQNKNIDDNEIFIDLLYDEHGYVIFIVSIDSDREYSMDFQVYEVVGWDEQKTPCDKNLYMSGCIKWDGCSHVWFGEKEQGKQDGYLHLCGKNYWQHHANMMMALYEMAERTIVKYDG